MRRITLLTDFGDADGYVAAMKGVIVALAPDALVEDAAHSVEAGDVAGAAWALYRYWDLYPEGTIHVVVVDPGVGSERRALGVQVAGRFLVGPDNGVFSHILREHPESHVVALRERRFVRPRVSATFHGRDVFAPVAAHLALGTSLSELGPVVDNPTQLIWPEPRRRPDGAEGVVVHTDRFGNLITNIPEEWCERGALVWVGDRMAGTLRRTYADVDPGELVALVGSSGLLEVSVRDGSAAVALDASRGTPVRLGGEVA